MIQPPHLAECNLSAGARVCSLNKDRTLKTEWRKRIYMRDWKLQLWIIMSLKLGGVAGEVKAPNGFLASVDLHITWRQMIAIFANYKGHEMMTVLLPASRILKLKNELQNGMSQKQD